MVAMIDDTIIARLHPTITVRRAIQAAWRKL